MRKSPPTNRYRKPFHPAWSPLLALSFVLGLAVLGWLSNRQYQQLQKLKAANGQSAHQQHRQTGQLLDQFAHLQQRVNQQLQQLLSDRLSATHPDSSAGHNQLQQVQLTLAHLSDKVNSLKLQIEQTQRPDTSSELHLRLAELNAQIAQSRQQLSDLSALYRQSEDIVAQVSPGVCLIQGEYMFVDPRTELPLRYSQDDSAAGLGGSLPDLPTEQARSAPDTLTDVLPVSISGKGKPLLVQYTGTGFLIDSRGYIITNGHVTTPWHVSPRYRHLLLAGYEGRLCLFRAIFPEVPEPIDLTIVDCRQDQDVALLYGAISSQPIPVLPCQTDPNQLKAGQTLIVLGYPTGFDALLARMTDAEIEQITAGPTHSFAQLARNMAHRHLIQPTATRGICGRVSPGKIVYDAQTAMGGSGAPVLGSDGKVIAINTALLKGFAGTNFGIPIHQALDLLRKNVGLDLAAASHQSAAPSAQ